MDRSLLLAIVIVFGLMLLALMFAGWRTRRARQSELPLPPEAPVELGSPLGVFAGKYVATSHADRPLDRIVSHGLGFRGKATTTVTEAGILIDRVGERAVWITRDAITAVGRATWTIDRVVEEDGLTLVQWAFGGLSVETTLRLDDPTGFDRAVDGIRETGAPDDLPDAPTDEEGSRS